MIARAFIQSLVGAVVILAVAYGFLMLDVPRAEAASCKGRIVTASWFGTESGNRTANGEHFDGSKLTAAHRTLPFGTKLRVTYRGKSVVVRVNDRGPAKWTGASLDLSRAAARRIGLGKDRVCVERL